MAGGDLFERVAATDYKLTEEKVQIFMKQIIKGKNCRGLRCSEQCVAGLQYIHSLGIVHLDIKPYNILFSDKVTQHH